MDIICQSGLHCPNCRDPNANAWRESLGKAYTLPDDAPDFQCPHGKPWGYQGGEPVQVTVSVTRPGDVLHHVIKAIAREEGDGDCGCNRMKQRMNAWGWTGCFKHRKEIVNHLAEQARKRGHDINERQIWGMALAGFRELRRKSQDSNI